MKIDYNILWFEDSQSSYSAKKEIVKQIIHDLGFNFPDPRLEVDGVNIDNIPYDDFDLIIVDLNLAGTKGTTLIDRIRNNGVYTEVVFYSSSGERAVREALREYEIDGVYCADRRNEDFELKIEKVIKTTLRKIQDVNNMRGLIIAETSDIDNTMLDIIETVIERNPANIKETLMKAISKNVGSKIDEKNKKYEKWKDNKVGKIIEDTLMFDSHQKVLAIQHIMDLIDDEITISQKNQVFENKYNEEIKECRNIFAHCIEKSIDGKRKLISKHKEIEFSDEFCSNTRRKIQLHDNILTDLLNYVKR